MIISDCGSHEQGVNHPAHLEGLGVTFTPWEYPAPAEHYEHPTGKKTSRFCAKCGKDTEHYVRNERCCVYQQSCREKVGRVQFAIDSKREVSPTFAFAKHSRERKR